MSSTKSERRTSLARQTQPPVTMLPTTRPRSPTKPLRSPTKAVVVEEPTHPAPLATTSEHSTSARSKKFKCEICHKSFSRPSGLQVHMHSHTGEQPFGCPNPGCDRRFNVMSNLRRHMRSGCKGSSHPVTVSVAVTTASVPKKPRVSQHAKPQVKPQVQQPPVKKESKVLQQQYDPRPPTPQPNLVKAQRDNVLDAHRAVKQEPIVIHSLPTLIHHIATVPPQDQPPQSSDETMSATDSEVSATETQKRTLDTRRLGRLPRIIANQLAKNGRLQP